MKMLFGESIRRHRRRLIRSTFVLCIPKISILIVMLGLCALPQPTHAQATSRLPSADYLPECQSLNRLEDLIGLNIGDLFFSEPRYEGWRRDGLYFCGKDAPKNLKCDCGIANVCAEAHDPWGRNMGYCGCCAPWLIILIIIMAVLFFLMLVIFSYTCLCDGKWLYNGYPNPVKPLLPSRTATYIAPASFPIPANAFGEEYPSEDFESHPEESVPAAGGGGGSNEGADRAPLLDAPSIDNLRRASRTDSNNILSQPTAPPPIFGQRPEDNDNREEADEEMTLMANSPSAASATSLAAVGLQQITSSVNSPLYQLATGINVSVSDAAMFSPDGTSSTRPLLASSTEPVLAPSAGFYESNIGYQRPPRPAPPKAPPTRFLSRLLNRRASTASSEPVNVRAAPAATAAAPQSREYSRDEEHNPFGNQNEAQFVTPVRQHRDASENPLAYLSSPENSEGSSSGSRLTRH